MPVDLLGGMGIIEAAQYTVTDCVALCNQIQHTLLHAQALQKHYTDARQSDVSFNEGEYALFAT